MTDAGIAQDFADRLDSGEVKMIKASQSPALARRREASRARAMKYAKRRGPEAVAQLERQIKAEEARRAERERIEAEARRRIEKEAEEAKIEREVARQHREIEAGPEQ